MKLILCGLKNEMCFFVCQTLVKHNDEDYSFVIGEVIG